MRRILCKLPLVAAFIIIFTTAAHADVSYEGYYLAIAVILGILFLPAIIVAIFRRTRQKLYLIVLILWVLAAFAYLWYTRAKQNEFFFTASVPYIILVVYLFKEKKVVKTTNA